MDQLKDHQNYIEIETKLPDPNTETIQARPEMIVMILTTKEKKFSKKREAPKRENGETKEQRIKADDCGWQPAVAGNPVDVVAVMRELTDTFSDYWLETGD